MERSSKKTKRNHAPDGEGVPRWVDATDGLTESRVLRPFRLQGLTGLMRRLAAKGGIIP